MKRPLVKVLGCSVDSRVSTMVVVRASEQAAMGGVISAPPWFVPQKLPMADRVERLYSKGGRL